MATSNTSTSKAGSTISEEREAVRPMFVEAVRPMYIEIPQKSAGDRTSIQIETTYQGKIVKTVLNLDLSGSGIWGIDLANGKVKKL